MKNQIHDLMQIQIQETYIRKFLGNIDAAAMKQTQVVFYFVSAERSIAIQQIDLKSVNRSKARLYQENCERIIPVIKKGDEIRAKISPEMAKELKEERKLNINGENIEFDVLSSEEFEELSQVTQAIFEELAKQAEAHQKESPDQEHKINMTQSRKNARTARQSSTEEVELFVQNGIAKIARHIAESMNEQNRILAERNKKEDEKLEAKKKDDLHRRIINDEIRQGELKHQIVKEEIEKTSR